MSRAFGSSSKSNAKVAVLGAAGGIGQPLSMLLKLSPEVTELSCYDIVNTPGVAADLSHIPTCAKVTGSLPPDRSTPPKEDTGLKEALTGCSVVVIPAGIPRKPGMSRDDLFSVGFVFTGQLCWSRSRFLVPFAGTSPGISFSFHCSNASHLIHA